MNLIYIPRQKKEMFIAVVCQPDRDVISFKVNLSNQAVFLIDQKVKTIL